MFHQPHAAVARPAFFVVVADDVFVVGVGMFGEVALDELAGFVAVEAEDHVDFVNVAAVGADGVGNFAGGVVEAEEFVGFFGLGASEVGGAAKGEDEEVEDEAW